MSASDVHIVVPTHTTRHLALALTGIGWQAEAPAHVVVSCDTDEAAIGAVIEEAADRWGMPIWWVRRAHHGEERLCQVRNNGVRHLAESLGVTDGRVLILDGDMVLSRGAVERHRVLGERGGLVLPYRIDVGERDTAGLDPDRLWANPDLLGVTGADRAALARRDRRYRKHLAMRRVRLGAGHKPKLLGGHFSCDWRLYLELNGFDELYRGWGFKDDEFAYRAWRRGGRSVPACERIPAWHLFHPTRQPGVAMRDLPTAERFARRGELPVVAEHGVESPLEQHEVHATRFGPESGGSVLADSPLAR